MKHRMTITSEEAETIARALDREIDADDREIEERQRIGTSIDGMQSFYNVRRANQVLQRRFAALKPVAKRRR